MTEQVKHLADKLHGLMLMDAECLGRANIEAAEKAAVDLGRWNWCEVQSRTVSVDGAQVQIAIPLTARCSGHVLSHTVGVQRGRLDAKRQRRSHIPDGADRDGPRNLDRSSGYQGMPAIDARRSPIQIVAGGRNDLPLRIVI